MTNRISVGDLYTATAANITNGAGTPTDPTVLLLKVRAPGASTVTTYTYLTDAIIVRDSAGNYHADIPITTDGIWAGSWIGTGAATFAEGFRFYAHPDVTT